MLYETGKVIAVDPDGLWIETLKQSACAQCSAKNGCGQKLLASAGVKNNMTFIKVFFSEAHQASAWQVGEDAVLGIEENALVGAALTAYLLPLLFFIAGVIASRGLLPLLPVNSAPMYSDGITAACGFVGLAFGALFVKLHAKRASKSSGYQAQLVGKSLPLIRN